MKNLNYLLIASVVAATSCAKKLNEDSTTVSANEAEVESAITAISSMMDEGAGINYSMKSAPSSILEFALPKAYAANCIRAVNSSCVNQVRSATYAECEIGAVKMSGTVELSYNQSNCSMVTDGSTLTRTYNLQRVGPRGGTLSTSSNSKQDYRTSVSAYGGGGRLTKISGGYSVEVLGKHKTLTIRDREVYNVSMRTTSALQISGGLDRASRTIVSGVLEVNHNIAGRTAVWTFNNVQYSSQCAHPVSGTIDIVWSGSKVGSAQLTFSACGIAQINEDGQNSQVELSYSE